MLADMKFAPLVMSCLLPAAALAWTQGCISKPVGFGYKTTGGTGGRTVVPTSPAELKQYLSSTETLIIDLDRTYDFTQLEGSKTENGCWYNQCGSGPQKSLSLYNACAGRSTTSVTYSVAGSRTLELVIGSNKTIRSSNGKGVIKGKGVTFKKSKNVIFRDITISDINPQVIWGGDAIVLNGATDIWIHRCTIRNIGRQFLVTYVEQNVGITVSSCLFDGNTQYSAYCDKTHFWLWLFWGTHDEITLINNRVVNVSGRCPHAGGQSSSSKNLIHMIGNEMDTNHHLGIEPNKGGIILAEGNKFIDYSQVIDTKATGGTLAIPSTAADAAKCQAYFKQNCKANVYQGTTAPSRMDLAVLDAFSKLDLTAVNGARAAACE
ncbi:Pectin lyase [Frankliniella occidentalis]|nr:Pectin lyase [Frankliniella occidentalis]